MAKFRWILSLDVFLELCRSDPGSVHLSWHLPKIEVIYNTGSQRNCEPEIQICGFLFQFLFIAHTIVQSKQNVAIILTKVLVRTKPSTFDVDSLPRRRREDFLGT